MQWKYFCPHLWDVPRLESEDVWLRPEDPNFRGNMGNRVNLSVHTLGRLQSCDDMNEQERELLVRLEEDEPHRDDAGRGLRGR